MIKQIEKIIDEKVRSALQAHNGDVEVLTFEDGICRIRLLGQCSNCPSAMATNEELIGKEIMDALPEVKDVVLVQEISEDLLNMVRTILNYER